MKIICESYWVGVSFWHSRRLPIEGCYKKIETVPLGVTHPCESCIEMRFFLTYRALKVARNYRPGRRKKGFDLRLGGAMPSGFLTNIWCMRSCLLLLASIGFVIKSSLPLIRPLSLASIAFVMTGVLARLSISLSKHCDLVPNYLMLAVVHSQQA